jgi:hypothetical protein
MVARVGLGAIKEISPWAKTLAQPTTHHATTTINENDRLKFFMESSLCLVCVATNLYTTVNEPCHHFHQGTSTYLIQLTQANAYASVGSFIVSI